MNTPLYEFIFKQLPRVMANFNACVISIVGLSVLPSGVLSLSVVTLYDKMYKMYKDVPFISENAKSS